jgi:hypothetical protein
VIAHQKTKKCQQFRCVTFICRNCSTAILGYDNIISHIDACKNDKAISHFDIVHKLTSVINKHVFGKGFNGKTVYLYNYERCIFTTGAPKPISESIVNQIDRMTEECTLKSLNETLTLFSREAFLEEIKLVYPQPLSIANLGILEQESRNVMAFVIATSMFDLFKIVLGSLEIMPVYNEDEELYIIDKVVRKNNKWNIDWKLNNSKEVSLSFKSFFLPALTFAIKLFTKEGTNHITTKILELIKDLSSPSKVTELLNKLATSSLKQYDDVNNTVSKMQYRFIGTYKHTPIDTLVRNINVEGKQDILKSLLLSMVKEEDKNALIKKINMDENPSLLEQTEMAVAQLKIL